MERGRRSRARETDLRLGAVVAEIEGLYTMLLRTGDPERRERILADLAHAGRRLTALGNAVPAQGRAAPVPPPSRLRRRRAMVLRGAEWISDRFGKADDLTGPDQPPHLGTRTRPSR